MNTPESGFDRGRREGAKIRPVPTKIGRRTDYTDEEKKQKLQVQAQISKRLRHQFHPDGPEFFVGGIQVYRRDVRVLWRPVHQDKSAHVGGVRGAITERSSRSRKLLSFTLANTETPLIGHLVLTWRVPPMDGNEVKTQLRYFLDALRKRWGKSIEYLWWLEFQTRGAPHIHVVTSGAIHDDLGTRQVMRWTGRAGARRQVMRTIYCGPEYDWMGARWLAAIGAEDCQKSRRWTAGGIWERWDTPDGAARYAAKDAWKPYQTKVPEEYQNVGAWWHRSRGFKSPVMLSEHLAGEDAIRAGLKRKKGRLYPTMFGATEKLKHG